MLRLKSSTITLCYLYREEIANRKDKEIEDLRYQVRNRKRILLDSKTFDQVKRYLTYDFVPITGKTFDHSENTKNNLTMNLKPRYSVAKK